MALYNYNGVIYSDTRIDSSGNPINPDRVIEKDFEVAVTDNVKSSAQDLCVVVELEGKLGVMVRSDEKGSGEVPVFRCARADFRYESIKVFVTKIEHPFAGPVCIIGSTEGKYHCFEISAIESGIDIQTLVYGDRYEDCIEAVISTDNGDYHIKDLDLVLGVASSSISTLAPGQVFVFGADRAGLHDGGAAEHAKKHFGAQVGVGDGLMGNSYAITTMDGPLGRLKVEIDKFLTYAMDHPEKEFLVTRVACGNAGWTDGDVAPLFHGIQTLDNVPIPMKWTRYITSEDMFSFTMYVLLSSCGRATLDEWVGRLAVLYAAHTNVPLNIVGNGICIAEGAVADTVCEALIKMTNAQNLSEEALNELSELRSTICSVSHEKFESWYSGSFLTKILQRECVELAEGTLLNPGINVKEVVNKLLVDSGCSRIYNPFAGICSLCDYSDIEYVCQEPSPILSMIAQICSGDCFTGDFMSNWIGGDCDGLACILPFEYSTDKDVPDSTKVRGQRITKQLLHRLTQPRSMKAAVVVVKKDVLTSDDYHAYRRTFIKQGHLARVIPLNERCLTNNAEDYVLLYFDFTKEYDSVRLACTDYIERLKFTEEDPYFDGIPTDSEKVVSRDYIVTNNYCLDYDIYNVPVFFHIPFLPLISYDALYDRQSCDDENFDFIPVSELLNEAKPVEKESDSSEVLNVYTQEVSLDRRIIAQGVTHKYGSTNHNDRIFNGKYLVVSRWGLFYSNGDNPFRTFSFNKVYTIDESKIDPNYLIGMLSEIPHFEKVYPYFESWRVPVIKGGLEDQRKLVDKYFPELVNTDKETKQYNIVTVGDGQLQEMSWYERSINVIGHYYSIEELRMDLDKDSIKRALDGIVIDARLDYIDNRCEGIQELSYMNINVPYYIISSGIDRQSILNSFSRIQREDIGTRIYDGNDRQTTISSIRADLQIRHTPDFLTRDEYKEQLDNARIIDTKWPEFKGVEAFLLEFLSECKKDGSKFPEKSFTNLRTIRDQILYQLSRVGAIPPLNDEGAMAALLADRIYTDDKTVYYQLKGLMPHVLAEGVRFIGNISNEAIHESEGNKELAMSLTHILLSLINWTAQQIREGFFERSHSGSWIKAVDFKNEHEVKSGNEYKVNNTLRNGKPYWYCDNIHIGGDNVKRLQPGKTLRIGKASNEKQPFITDDVQCIFYCEDWVLVD